MSDILKRAWDLLEVEERPEGWSFDREHERTDGPWGGARWSEPRLLRHGHQRINPDWAKAELTVAVEGVLLAKGMEHSLIGSIHIWGRLPDVYGEAKCRLTSAVEALEIVRRKA